jgi:hypothetical protein
MGRSEQAAQALVKFHNQIIQIQHHYSPAAQLTAITTARNNIILPIPDKVKYFHIAASVNAHFPASTFPLQ